MNNENLKKKKSFTSDTGRIAGIKSGESRRKKRLMFDSFFASNYLPLTKSQKAQFIKMMPAYSKVKDINVEDVISTKIVSEATISGNHKARQIYLRLLDLYYKYLEKDNSNEWGSM